MYFELIINCSLSLETPKVCIDAIDYLCNSLFSNVPRTSTMISIENFIDKFHLIDLLKQYGPNSGCAEPLSFFKFNGNDCFYHFFVRSDVHDESLIEPFLDYLKPYIVKGSGSKDIYAYVLQEDSPIPTYYSLL